MYLLLSTASNTAAGLCNSYECSAAGFAQKCFINIASLLLISKINGEHGMHKYACVGVCVGSCLATSFYRKFAGGSS